MNLTLNNSLIGKNFGYTFFKLTILFLPTIPFLASLFGVCALISSTRNNKNFLQDKYNYLLLVCGFFMTLSIVIKHLTNPLFPVFENWINLFNWLPFFWCFWAFQSFLNTFEKRKECITFFLIGSIPVLIGGFLQFFFRIYGPFSFLNGLFIWYQRPLCVDQIKGICSSAITSLFSHPNYYSSWLSIIIPFAIGYTTYFFARKSKIKLLSFLFSSLVILSIFLTASRNGILALYVSTTLVFLGIRNKVFYKLIFISLFLFLSLILLVHFFGSNFEELLPVYFGDKFDKNLLDFLSFTRIRLYIQSFQFIFRNPLIGNGMPLDLPLMKIANISHSHNMLLDFSLIYGLLPSVPLIVLLFSLVKSSLSDILLNNKLVNNPFFNIFDRSWCISFLVIFLVNMFDMTYYDLRISLSFWILMAGIRCIIRENYKIVI